MVQDSNIFESAIWTHDQLQHECASNLDLSKAMFDRSKITLLCTNSYQYDWCLIIIDINNSHAGAAAQCLYDKSVILFSKWHLIWQFILFK